MHEHAKSKTAANIVEIEQYVLNLKGSLRAPVIAISPLKF